MLLHTQHTLQYCINSSGESRMLVLLLQALEWPSCTDPVIEAYKKQPAAAMARAAAPSA